MFSKNLLHNDIVDMSEQIKPQEHPVEVKRDNAIQVLGYRIPYWVLIVVALVVVYFLYQRGTFDGLLGRQTTVVTLADNSVLQVPTVEPLLETPPVIKRLFR